MTQHHRHSAGRGRSLISLMIALIVLTGALSAAAQSASPSEPGADLSLIEFTKFASLLFLVTDFEFTPDGRLLVTEKQGKVRLVEPDGTVLEQPFLDLTGQVSYAGEEGLVSIVLHPAYEENGYLYINYTDLDEVTRIVRYQVSAADPNSADPASALTLLTVAQPSVMHNGGELLFGPDGYLYIGMGDGGPFGDPNDNGQNGQTFFGAILRIDVDAGSPYSVPADNPFVGDASVLDEIWAMGLRNPWRLSFDRLNGDLYISDVGESEFEEINLERAGSAGGANYGWRCYEGDAAHNLEGCQEAGIYDFPIFTLSHPAVCAVIGGGVYRGDSESPIYGHYLLGDYCSGAVWGIVEHEPGRWRTASYGFAPLDNLTTFGQDRNGEWYAADFGNIYRLSARLLSTQPIIPRSYLPLLMDDGS